MSNEIKLSDSCLICMHWRSEENGLLGACYRYPRVAEGFKTFPPAHVCGEFQKDPFRDIIETSKVMTLLEGKR